MDAYALDELIKNDSGNKEPLMLYDRPEGMAVIKGEDWNSHFALKLVQQSKDFIVDGYYDVCMELITRYVDSSSLKRLMLAIGKIGGAYREQLNLLGLYSIAEKSGQISCCAKRVYVINNREYQFEAIKRKDFKVSGNIKQIFYYVSDYARELVRESLLLGGNNPANEGVLLNPLLDTHVENLCHAAGVNDFYCYLLGNMHYPTRYFFKTEQSFNYSETSYLVVDAYVDTQYKTNGNAYSSYDYIEVDTGSQSPRTITSKLERYTDYFCSVSPSQLVQSRLMFIHHPPEIIGSKPAGNKKKGINVNTSDLLLLYMLSNQYGTNSLSELYSCIFRDSGFTSECSLSEDDDVVYSAFDKARGQLLKILNDYIIRGYGSSPIDSFIETILRDNDNNNNTSSLEGMYHSFYDLFLKRRKAIFSTAVGNLKKNSPDQFKKFNKLCLAGLSVANVFGGDMYRTFLAVQPNFTGCIDAVSKLLCDYDVITSRIYAEGPVFEPYVVFKSEGSDLYVLRNVVHFGTENEFSLIIEDIDMDYGASIRIANALSDPGTAALPYRLCIVVDSIESAFDFLVNRCYKFLNKKSLVSAQNFFDALPEDDKLLASNLPLFIPRENLVDIMCDYRLKKGPFVIRSLNSYRRVLNKYGKKADDKFPSFFKRNCTRDELIKDIVFL